MEPNVCLFISHQNDQNCGCEHNGLVSSIFFFLISIRLWIARERARAFLNNKTLFFPLFLQWFLILFICETTTTMLRECGTPCTDCKTAATIHNQLVAALIRWYKGLVFRFYGSNRKGERKILDKTANRSASVGCRFVSMFPSVCFVFRSPYLCCLLLCARCAPFARNRDVSRGIFYSFRGYGLHWQTPVADLALFQCNRL